MMEQFYDPLRKKYVAATDEERVRQWFIKELSDTSKVPRHLMMSEAGFRFGDKQYRADILIFDRAGQPLAIVECKRPEIGITQDVAIQALRYDAVLSVRFIFLTNGKSTCVFRRDGGSFSPFDHFPSYEEML